MIKINKFNTLLVSALCSSVLLGCVSNSQAQPQQQLSNKNSALFSKTQGVIPFDK